MRHLTSALRPYALAVLLAVASAIVAIVVAGFFGLPLRDPDGFLGPAYIRLPMIVVMFVLVDVLPRAIHRREAVRQVLRRRYPPERVALVTVGLTAFYLTYVSYRNLKGALPFARPKVLDQRLLVLDQWMMFGQDPAVVLHDLLGAGVVAYFPSAVYLLFLGFVPLFLGAALVWGRNVRSACLYVTALCLNWLLGTLPYYLVPSLGPVFVRPDLFADLPDTGVSALQATLAATRLAVLDDPMAVDSMAGVAGFASLHVSIVFTAALIAHRVGLPPMVRASLWVFLALTGTATIYFGWHYLVDDIAGLGVGAASVALAERVIRGAGTSLGAAAPQRDFEASAAT